MFVSEKGVKAKRLAYNTYAYLLHGNTFHSVSQKPMSLHLIGEKKEPKSNNHTTKKVLKA